MWIRVAYVMARTLAQIDVELAAVNAAITGILAGAQSSTSADGSRIERGSLDTLRQMKADLIAERDRVEGRALREAGGSVLLGEV